MIATPLDLRNFSKYPVTDTYHPSVVYSKDGWNGHHFWMVQTPYSTKHIEPYKDRYELPCILFSDDGIHWDSIPNNPIDDLSAADIQAHNYLSDPHLILKDGHLELYYRYTILKDKQLDGNKTVLFRKISANGIDWSEREIIADLQKDEDVAIWGEQIISPAVIWKDNQYYCWYVDASSFTMERHIRLTTSKDGVCWAKSVLCDLPDKEIIPWHLDVQFFDDNYQLLLFDINNQKLAHYTSSDAVLFSCRRILLQPTYRLYDYYSQSLYRASSVKVGNNIYVYISGHNGDRCSIGLWQTKDFYRLSPVQGMNAFTYMVEYRILQRYLKAIQVKCQLKLKRK